MHLSQGNKFRTWYLFLKIRSNLLKRLLKVVHLMPVQLSFIATNLHSVQRYKWRSLIYLDVLLKFLKLASIETKHTTVSHHELVTG